MFEFISDFFDGFGGDVIDAFLTPETIGLAVTGLLGGGAPGADAPVPGDIKIKGLRDVGIEQLKRPEVTQPIESTTATLPWMKWMQFAQQIAGSPGSNPFKETS